MGTHRLHPATVTKSYCVRVTLHARFACRAVTTRLTCGLFWSDSFLLWSFLPCGLFWPDFLLCSILAVVVWSFLLALFCYGLFFRWLIQYNRCFVINTVWQQWELRTNLAAPAAVVG